MASELSNLLACKTERKKTAVYKVALKRKRRGARAQKKTSKGQNYCAANTTHTWPQSALIFGKSELNPPAALNNVRATVVAILLQGTNEGLVCLQFHHSTQAISTDHIPEVAAHKFIVRVSIGGIIHKALIKPVQPCVYYNEQVSVDMLRTV